MWRKPFQIQIFKRHSDHGRLFRRVDIPPLVGGAEEFWSVEPVYGRADSNQVLRPRLDLRRKAVPYGGFFQRVLDFTGSQRPPVGSTPAVQNCKNAALRPD